MFIETGHVLNSGAEFLRYRNMRYYLYVIPDDIVLLEKWIFSYGWNLGIAKEGEGNRSKDVGFGDGAEVTVAVEIEKE